MRLMFDLSRLLAVSMCALAMSSVPARAATLQISPVSVELPPGATASALTLRNPGDTPLYGQVRVFRWDQSIHDDVLTPTQDVIASPPLIQIPARTEQLIRLVRIAAAPVASEESFRVLIDELPAPDTPSANGVTIRLRYSVPVFIEPAASNAQPQLSWRLLHDAQGWHIVVGNTGTRRAQIAGVQLVTPDGKVYEINKGLLGYALAGRDRQWSVSLPPDAKLDGLKVRAAVNASPTEAAVTVSDGS
jgi:fimbrial chaperone protein